MSRAASETRRAQRLLLKALQAHRTLREHAFDRGFAELQAYCEFTVGDALPAQAALECIDEFD